MKKPIVVRMLIVLAIVAIYLLLNSYHCIILRFSRFDVGYFPAKDSVMNYVALLYGKNLCSSCPAGRYLNSIIVEHPDILIIVPSSFTPNDVENLRQTFGIPGSIINGKEQLTPIIKKIAACAANKEAAKNFLLTLKNDGKILRATIF